MAMAEQCPTCGQPTAYNGWPNYETWVVHLWLSNDQGTEQTMHDLVTEASSCYAAGDTIQMWVEEQCPLAEQASVFVDLLGHALGRVEWAEVARAFQEA
jgi:hypothetical protein